MLAARGKRRVGLILLNRQQRCGQFALGACVVLWIDMALPETREQGGLRTRLLFSHSLPGTILWQRWGLRGSARKIQVSEIVVRSRLSWLRALNLGVLAAPGGHRGLGKHRAAYRPQNGRVDPALFKEANLRLGGMLIHIDLPGIDGDIHHRERVAAGEP